MTDLTADKPRRLSKLAQDTLDIVARAQRRGRGDLTIAEILHALRSQARPGAVIEKSSLSRELTHLALDGQLLRRTEKRKSAWEALPLGVDQQHWPASHAYYVPGVRAGVAAAPAAVVAEFY